MSVSVSDHVQDFLADTELHPDTCRICSAPAEPDQPLFHPCKCSGTIRYIHQDWSVVVSLSVWPLSDIALKLDHMVGSQQEEILRCLQISVLFHERYASFLHSHFVSSLLDEVYSPNMPKHLPFILFLRRFAQQLLWGIVLGLRAMMVAIIWLAFLPFVTVWTWRFYFIVGENTYV